MLCVVEALDVVARWCVIGAPAHLKSGCMNESTCTHGSSCALQRERPCGVLDLADTPSCCRGNRCSGRTIWRNLCPAERPKNIENLNWDFLSTSAIILAQLLCWRGTITSSTSSNAIQSYLCKDVKFKSSTIQSYLCLQDFGEAHYCCSSANAMQQRKMQRKECSMHIAFHSAYSL